MTGEDKVKVRRMPVGPLATNCYVVSRGDRALVVDPGDEGEKIWSYLEDRGLTLDLIIQTHGHFDHVGATGFLRKKAGADVYMHGADASLVREQEMEDSLPDHDLGETAEIEWRGLNIQVMPTPGHSPGSVSLIVGPYLFTGDTLFAGGVGRTDLPGGSVQELRNSLRLLLEQDESLEVLPGHGPRTTLPEERARNPFLVGLD